MKFSVEESKNLIEWLEKKGLGIAEAAEIVLSIELGETLAFALVSVFDERKKMMEKFNEKYPNFGTLSVVRDDELRRCE